MGHRANYVVRRNGRVDVFYSHWGGLRLLGDLFWGPDAAARMIHDCEPADGLLDDVWCEGAALVDHDARRLLVFGVECGGGRVERRLLLDLYRLTWTGWRAEYATGGIGQIAHAVGTDPEPLTASMVDEPVDPGDIAAFDPEDGYESTLVAIRGETGWTHHLPGVDVLSLLAAGPAVIDRVREVPPVDPAAGVVREHASGGVIVDTAAREVRFFTDQERWHPEDRLGPAWAGWAVRRHDDGLRPHFTASGLTPPPPDPGAADRVLAFLAADSFDGVELMRRVLGHMAREDPPGVREVNPSAMAHAQVEVGPTRRADILRRAAAHLGRPVPPGTEAEQF